jgi:hypothetical protein
VIRVVRLLRHCPQVLSKTRLFSFTKIGRQRKRCYFAFARFCTTTREAVPNPSFEIKVEVSLASRLVTGAKRLFERNTREVPVLSLKMLEESAAVATACGHQPSEAVLARHAAAMTEPGSSLTSSMYRDLRKGAPVEADHILGDFIERGVATPLLKAAFVNLRIYQAGLPKP